MIEPVRTDLGDGAWVDLWPGLVADPDGSRMAALLAELPLASESYRMGARVVTAPRLVSWHGDPGTDYVYSGVRHPPQPWTPMLDQLRQAVQAATGLSFNTVLANLYRDGSDSMGWHRDAEPEIGPRDDDRWIASLSLGHRRRFAIKRKRGGERTVFDLGDGDLLVMRGTTQTHYRHSVAKTKRPVGPRLNLTFRHWRAV